MIDDLKWMKCHLVDVVKKELSEDIANVNTCELGEVIDIIKDLSETIVNCQIIDSMENASEEEKEHYLTKYNKAHSRMYFDEKKNYNIDDVVDMIHNMANGADVTKIKEIKQKLIETINAM